MEVKIPAAVLRDLQKIVERYDTTIEKLAALALEAGAEKIPGYAARGFCGKPKRRPPTSAPPTEA